MDRRAHETGLAEFLLPARRARFLASLDDPRLRGRLRQRLWHFPDLDPRWAEPIVGAGAFPAPLLIRLREAGAPEACLLVATDDDLDGRHCALADALQHCSDHDVAALVSCIPGRLAIHLPEAPGAPSLLHRPAR